MIDLSENVNMQPKPTLKQSGFTLLEGMIIIGILGILAAIAGPSFTNTLNANAVKNTSYEVRASLELARTYALSQRSGINTIVCRVDNRGDQACGAASTDWSNGWVVMYNGILQGAFVPNPRVRVSASAVGQISFNRRGMTIAAAPTFDINDATNTNTCRVSLMATGIVRPGNC